MKTIVSKQGSLQGRDYLKALFIGALTAALFGGIDALQGISSLADVNWSLIGHAAVSGFLAYIMKNLVEPTKVVSVIKGEEAEDYITANSGGGTNPPPVGDPTHPPKPPVPPIPPKP